jgi:hypothetical protein
MVSSTKTLSKRTRRPLVQRFSRAILLRYYKHIYSKKILTTKPVSCSADSAFEVHVLTRDQELLETLWSLKTWYHFSGTRPPLVVYEGGTLSSESSAILEGHFPNCRIIRRDRFDRDMRDFLRDRPAALEHALIRSFYCALKLFGPMRYTKARSVLYIDSDILFFRAPLEMMEHIERGLPFFNSDYQDAYAHPLEFIRKKLRMKLEPTINAGLFHIVKRDLASSLELVEEYFSNIPVADPTHWTINRHEQTANAIILSRANALRLSDDHQISKTPVTDRTVSHHFVDDGSRPDYYAKGMHRLKAIGFLKQLARKP